MSASTATFNMVLSHTFERLSIGGDSLYTANLSQAKLVWNFQRTGPFVRAMVQYQHPQAEPGRIRLPGRYPDPERLHPVPVLLQAQPADGSLFLGYSDNALGGVFDSSLGPGRIGITRTNRTFFLKIGYAWQI